MHRTWRNFAYAVIVACQFSPTCYLWPLSDADQNSVSTRYRENKWMEFHPILHLCIYIGKILDGILPVGLHKFVTELWTLIDIFTT